MKLDLFEAHGNPLKLTESPPVITLHRPDLFFQTCTMGSKRYQRQYWRQGLMGGTPRRLHKLRIPEGVIPSRCVFAESLQILWMCWDCVPIPLEGIDKMRPCGIQLYIFLTLGVSEGVFNYLIRWSSVAQPFLQSCARIHCSCWGGLLPFSF